ncbi:MAG: hypothetical protein ACKO26_24705 [Planctomycetota bacterium]
MGMKRGLWLVVAGLGHAGVSWGMEGPGAGKPTVLPPISAPAETPGPVVLPGAGHSKEGLGIEGPACGPNGCATHAGRKDRCGIIPKGALPDPSGMKFKNLINTQAMVGTAGLLFFYNCEWEGDSDRLGPSAYTRLARLMCRVRAMPVPVMIERTADPVLDEKRRTAMVEQLVMGGVLDASDRVHVGYPLDGGLEGLDAERIYYNLRINPNNFNGMGGRSGGGRLGMFSGFFGGGGGGGGFR